MVKYLGYLIYNGFNIHQSWCFSDIKHGRNLTAMLNSPLLYVDKQMIDCKNMWKNLEVKPEQQHLIFHIKECKYGRYAFC